MRGGSNIGDKVNLLPGVDDDFELVKAKNHRRNAAKNPEASAGNTGSPKLGYAASLGLSTATNTQGAGAGVDTSRSERNETLYQNLSNGKGQKQTQRGGQNQGVAPRHCDYKKPKKNLPYHQKERGCSGMDPNN